MAIAFTSTVEEFATVVDGLVCAKSIRRFFKENWKSKTHFPWCEKESRPAEHSGKLKNELEAKIQKGETVTHESQVKINFWHFRQIVEFNAVASNSMKKMHKKRFQFSIIFLLLFLLSICSRSLWASENRKMSLMIKKKSFYNREVIDFRSWFNSPTSQASLKEEQSDGKNELKV